MSVVAITRAVSRALPRCELTHLSRRPIDVALARSQHADYEKALREAGCDVRQLVEEPDFPDSVFVEDTAIVLDQVAVITRPGAASRRGERPSVEHAIEGLRAIRRIESPGTLDGGDVLRLGSRLYVGASGRTNEAATTQLAKLVEPFGYSVESIPITGCLHLKSAVAQAGEHTLLLNAKWISKEHFDGWNVVDVDASESYAANCVYVNGMVIYPRSFPKTAAKLAALGAKVTVVDVSELQKAEGAVTCCSILIST